MSGLVIILLLLMLSIAGYGYIKLDRIGEELKGITNEDMPLIELASDITTKQLESAILIERALRDAGVKSQVEQVTPQHARAEFRRISEVIDDEITSAEQLLASAITHAVSAEIEQLERQLQSELASLKNNHKSYESDVANILTQIENGHIDDASRSLVQLEKQQKALNHQLEAFLVNIEAMTEMTLKVVEDEEKAAIYGMSLIGLIAIVAGGGLGYLFTRSLVKPLQRAADASHRMASGDLSVSVRADHKDEMGVLLNTMDDTARKLEQMIGKVLQSSNQIASSAQEMAAATEQTNQAINFQQSTTEQVVSAMNEMSTTIQQVADQAVNASQATESANQDANSGVEIMTHHQKEVGYLVSQVSEASEKIDTLKNESNDIGSFVTVINEIADQTNLLALNAAIEAARAGEQGRGFAVVADEVRSLAFRTQEATQQIQKLIEQLQQGAVLAVQVMNESRLQVEASVERAASAGESLQSINHSIESINGMNMEIATISEQQSIVAEEINQNMVNISESGKEVLGGSYQTALSSESLAELAVELRELMGQFKLSAQNAA
ncbi:methyl-accepting chemotaxis protein [Vibrio sp. SCSIO 43137]|uniref:methyl-accepting chemotaxis protein n=1 Tax=Vibrio sp. SCSIO 43137 TaxID=3021011 RepID=UPI002FE26072